MFDAEKKWLEDEEVNSGAIWNHLNNSTNYYSIPQPHNNHHTHHKPVAPDDSLLVEARSDNKPNVPVQHHSSQSFESFVTNHINSTNVDLYAKIKMAVYTTYGDKMYNDFEGLFTNHLLQHHEDVYGEVKDLFYNPAEEQEYEDIQIALSNEVLELQHGEIINLANILTVTGGSQKDTLLTLGDEMKNSGTNLFLNGDMISGRTTIRLDQIQEVTLQSNGDGQDDWLGIYASDSQSEARASLTINGTEENQNTKEYEEPVQIDMHPVENPGKPIYEEPVQIEIPKPETQEPRIFDEGGKDIPQEPRIFDHGGKDISQEPRIFDEGAKDIPQEPRIFDHGGKDIPTFEGPVICVMEPMPDPIEMAVASFIKQTDQSKPISDKDINKSAAVGLGTLENKVEEFVDTTNHDIL